VFCLNQPSRSTLSRLKPCVGFERVLHRPIETTALIRHWPLNQ
jgi:hypothetical protein